MAGEQLDRLTTALAERYAVQRELGSGGMATVYLAKDLKHDGKVAVKVLRPELSRTPASDSRDPGCPRRLQWGNPCDA